MKDKHYRLGCDIGGTFTDFVLLNDQTGEMKTGKCLTTPHDPSDAVEEGIRELEAIVPDFVAQLDELIHGTTLVINSIIERKGARTGLITTKGFRDVLEIGREGIKSMGIMPLSIQFIPVTVKTVLEIELTSCSYICGKICSVFPNRTLEG